jgi:TM2 domain-containing membrane protein YozV
MKYLYLYIGKTASGVLTVINISIFISIFVLKFNYIFVFINEQILTISVSLPPGFRYFHI